MASPPPSPSTATDHLALNISYRGHTSTVNLPPSSTLHDLVTRLATDHDLPSDHIKLLCAPRPGLIKPPYAAADSPQLSTLMPGTRKIQLLAPSAVELAAVQPPAPGTHDAMLQRRIQASGRPNSPKTIRQTNASAQSSSRRDPVRTAADARFTFHQIQPLPHFRNADKARALLQRLADDPGIRAAMRKWSFSVLLLTEMDPAEHTTHESRTLGLNRNHGEVIELRLRTDAYDGFRDYKTIRRTLCHELTHNVHSDHDRNFWELCRQIEAYVQQEDWKGGSGHKVGGAAAEFYEPEDDEGLGEEVDGGVWKGGDFVVGGTPEQGGMSRRELLARAAEARRQRPRTTEPD